MKEIITTINMNHGSLFSGIGGFDLAAEWMGWNNIFHCELNPFCRKILNYYWPEAASYEDITKTDFTGYRGTIDIISGGFPCQPFSVAGKRKGTSDTRYLWPEMLRAIREIQPTWVVGENVRGLISWNEGMVFKQVCIDLEAEGFEVFPVVLPACGIDAPHRRERVWIVGYSQHNGSLTTKSRRDDEKPSFKAGTDKVRKSQGANCIQSGFVAHCSNTGAKSVQRKRENRIHGSETVTDPAQSNKQRDRVCKECEQRSIGRCDSLDVANSNGIRLRNEINRTGKSRFINEKGKTPDWENFPTVAPVCDGDDGLSTRLDFDAVFTGVKKPRKANTVSRWRNESIKAGGNAVVPHLPYQLFKAIDIYNIL